MQFSIRPSLAVLLSSTLLAAQSTHRTPFTGTWKLNVAQSKFNPGPPFQRFTIQFSPDGVRHLNLVRADGEHLQVTLPWSDGKEVAVEGMNKTSATSIIEGRKFHDIWKQDGRVIENVHGVLSSDRKTMRTTVDATDPQGRRYHNELTFEKQ